MGMMLIFILILSAFFGVYAKCEVGGTTLAFHRSKLVDVMSQCHFPLPFPFEATHVLDTYPLP